MTSTLIQVWPQVAKTYVPLSFVRLLLRDPSAETVERSNALAQERGGELADVCECVHDV